MTRTSVMTRSADDEKVVALDDDGPTAFDVRSAYAEHGRVLFGFVLNGVGDRGLAEDCVQETFLRAWRSRDRYHPERASQRTWLFAIARNVVIDALRARARRPRLVAEDRARESRAAADAAGSTGPATDQTVEDRLVLLAGLARLSPEHRQVVVAVQLEGMGYDQLSERTGVPVGTLRSRMYYGLRALREILGEEEDDE